jgi:hypothetical protein
MSVISNIAHHTIFTHPEHCVNQIATRTLRNGDILAVFNERHPGGFQRRALCLPP